MEFADYLSEEWRPSLGCTEPAAIAYATSMAASHQRGGVRLVRLVCDARTYKNCYSVGIPNSERHTGLLWTLAIGAHLADHSLGLRCFEQTDARALQAAGLLLEQHGIHVEVDPGKTALFIDVTVVKETGTARVVLTREHIQVSRIEVFLRHPETIHLARHHQLGAGGSDQTGDTTSHPWSRTCNQQVALFDFNLRPWR
jgi:L-cysteine desulfidase